ncbi:MAG: DUF1330 domain-containing protein [Pseudomonadota bacterium]
MTTTPPPGFWMVHVTIKDPEVYQDYATANGQVLEKYGAVFLARGGRYEPVEGLSRERHIVIQFESYDTALACYHDPEYQHLARKRQTSAETELVIVEGIAQP